MQKTNSQPTVFFIVGTPNFNTSMRIEYGERPRHYSDDHIKRKAYLITGSKIDSCRKRCEIFQRSLVDELRPEMLEQVNHWPKGTDFVFYLGSLAMEYDADAYELNLDHCNVIRPSNLIIQYCQKHSVQNPLILGHAYPGDPIRKRLLESHIVAAKPDWDEDIEVIEDDDDDDFQPDNLTSHDAYRQLEAINWASEHYGVDAVISDWYDFEGFFHRHLPPWCFPMRKQEDGSFTPMRFANLTDMIIDHIAEQYSKAPTVLLEDWYVCGVN